MKKFAKRIRDDDTFSFYKEQAVQEGGEMLELAMIGMLWDDTRDNEAHKYLKHVKSWSPGTSLPHVPPQYNLTKRRASLSGLAKRVRKRQRRI